MAKYKPHPKQARFHSVCGEDGVRYVWFNAGIGTGKTLAGIHECLLALNRNPGFDGCILAPTYPMFRDVILPQWQEFVPHQLYTFFKKDNYFKMWTGQTIFVRTCERPEFIRGLNLAWAWGDELGLVPDPDAWNILRGRVGRTLGIPHPYIFVTTTPKGWSWLAKEFLRAGTTDYRTIRARTRDNPLVPQSFIDGLRRAYGDEFARQELDAEILEMSGLCWPINRAIHCAWDYDDLRRVGIDKVVGGVDWGFAAPCAIVALALGKDRRWYLCEEHYKTSMLPTDIYAKMFDMQKRWKVRTWYADAAEPARIAEASGKGLHCVPVRKGDGSINKGVQEVRQLLAVKGDGKPSLFVHPSMKNFLREADDYHYPANGGEKPVGESGDHACDAVRYAVHSEQNQPRVIGYY